MEVNWHRRRALEVVSQLPEDPGDALQVLDLARGLIQLWLMDEACGEAEIIPLRAVRSVPD
jgi:hypothetical protein